MNTTNLFVFEGIDGCGKDTVIDRLYLALRRKYKVIVIPSITDSVIGSHLQLLVEGKGAEHKQLVAMFIADYYNKIRLIEHAMQNSYDIVLCNRWITSTLAYSGDISLMPAIEKLASSDIIPDVIYYMDVSVSAACTRRLKQGKRTDTYSGTRSITNAKINYEILLKDNKYAKEVVKVNAKKDKDEVYDTIFTDIVERI